LGAAPDRKAPAPALVIAVAALCAMIFPSLSPAAGGKSTPDRRPPTSPRAARVTASTKSTIGIAWKASTDNRKVTGYGVILDGTRTKRVTARSAGFAGLACGTAHRVSVVARDAAGNHSKPAFATAKTAACPSVPPSGGAGSATPGSGAGTETGGGPAIGGSTETGAAGDPGTSSDAAAPAADPGATGGTGAGGGSAGSADLLPPSAPLALSVSPTSTTLAVTWPRSTDNVGVAGYDVSVDGVPRGSTSQTSYLAAGLACATAHRIDIAAFDTARNRSPVTSATASTTACPTPPPAPTTANVFVAPNGSDGGANCKRFAALVTSPDPTGA
jgi:hypothetical protein